MYQTKTVLTPVNDINASAVMFLQMDNPNFMVGETWGFPGSPVEHIETHAAHVFLCGNRAFKIKKDVKLPYLDFSTIDLRRTFIDRELVINREFAPDIYLTTIEKEGEPVLIMKRFDTQSILSWQVDHDGISDQLSGNLAASVAESHRKAAPATATGADIMTGLGEQLSKAFAASPDIFPAAQASRFTSLYQNLLRRLTPLLNRRGKTGLVRRCHGDMHCGNIVVIEGSPVLFDAIEFSEKIATIDVLYDLAFLIMDLLRHRQDRAANILLNRYLHLRRTEEDLSGLEALPLFLATRAGVRALVTADLAHELPVAQSTEQRRIAYDYFGACLDFLQPKPPVLICIGGLSGTGKSTLAASLAPTISPLPGAIHIRSDVERKVLAGVAENVHLAPEHYSQLNSQKIYDAILDRAGRVLAAGCSVVIDAVFSQSGERLTAQQLAVSRCIDFHGFWLEAAERTLKARVTSRHGDASDATPEVIDRQLKYDLGEITWTRIDASGSPAEVEACALSLLELARTQLRSGADSV
jgi:uncharacterized protein